MTLCEPQSAVLGCSLPKLHGGPLLCRHGTRRYYFVYHSWPSALPLTMPPDRFLWKIAYQNCCMCHAIAGSRPGLPQTVASRQPVVKESVTKHASASRSMAPNPPGRPPGRTTQVSLTANPCNNSLVHGGSATIILFQDAFYREMVW